MNPQEIMTRLENVLHRDITPAERLHLAELVDEYLRGSHSWPEFHDLAAEELSRIRTFYENKRLELAGKLEVAPASDGVDHQPEPVPVDLDAPTVARSQALDALNHLRSRGPAPPRNAITGVLLPRGGVDGTVPQWVYVIAAELWMPAEEVARAFRARQRGLMVEADQPRTKSRAFEVARFVWEAETAYGEHLPWPELCRLWNERPMTTPFDNWRDFRTYFKRGEKAALPRYKATDEQITEQVREASSHGRAVAFELWTSQVLAATVQQGHDAR